MSRIEDIRARLAAITDTPWWEEPDAEGEPAVWGAHLVADEPVAHLVADPGDGARRDRANRADFIAHAPVDLRDLLAVADAAREVLAQWDIGEIGDSAGVLDALDATFARLDAATDGER